MRFIILLLIIVGSIFIGMEYGDSIRTDIECSFHDKTDYKLDDSLKTKIKCSINELNE